MSRENFAFFSFLKSLPCMCPLGGDTGRGSPVSLRPQSLPLPPYYLIVSTLMVLVLPDAVDLPAGQDHVVPFSRWQTRFAWCSA